MTLQVMPPEMLANTASDTGAKKEFQSVELLPNKIES